MTDTVRIGLICCGGISQRHVQWLLEKSECEIAALCDVAEAAVQTRLGHVRQIRPSAAPRLCADWREVVGDPALDAVAVLLPHALHYPVVKAALQAGKHVLVEKPMVTQTAHALDLVAEAGRAGRLLAIAYQRSYLPEYCYVRRMIETGELGAIRFITGHLEQAWYASFRAAGSSGSWRNQPDQAGGGQLVDTGSHTVAAMLQVTGLAPEEAFAFIDRCGLAVDVDTAAVIRFTGGAIASLSIGGFGHSVTEVLRVVGDKASARIFFRTVREQSLEVNGQIVDAKAAIPLSNPDANFVDAILGKTPIGADGQLGVRTAQLTEAIYKSARTNAPVRIE
ncbi:MAG: Gfo/Idh/MocA family oxidoreductase [bacterium]|nr:Gfo/Idh/MocA family oxidoreductase [bacterium]